MNVHSSAMPIVDEKRANPSTSNQGTSAGTSASGTSSASAKEHGVDFKQKYRNLKRKLQLLIYVSKSALSINMMMRSNLRQRKTIKSLISDCFFFLATGKWNVSGGIAQSATATVTSQSWQELFTWSIDRLWDGRGWYYWFWCHRFKRFR